MLKKIHELYPNSTLFNNQQEMEYSSEFHSFRDAATGDWLRIPFKDLDEKELRILKTMFEYHEPSIYRHSSAQMWYNFLFHHGPVPTSSGDFRYRIIQFQCNGTDWERTDIETALKGFFYEDLILFWENDQRGIMVDKDKNSLLSVEDFQSMAQTIESDFYIKTVFYVGKFQPLSNDSFNLFQLERNFFEYSMDLKSKDQVLTFEKQFPAVVTKQLKDELKDSLNIQLLDVLKEDPDLLLTIKVFLENNLNATLTAKKLYIHRNTLQYRIDKFSEKTGVNLKDFESAITVYLSCLLYGLNH